MINQDGRCLFVCSYDAGDTEGVLDIWAYDWEEAEAIVKGIRDSLIVNGQVIERGYFSGSMQ